MKISSLNKKNILSSLKFAVVIPAALAVRLIWKNVWIITERPAQARDNGFVFFRYLRTDHPECKAYYVIDKTGVDYRKIRQYGNIIQFDSWKHYFYYCLSRIHISAHIQGCCPSNSPICRRLKYPLGIKDVFLPHGVSYGVSEFCLQKYARQDLFICSGKPEYDNVLANYGYKPEEVAYTGFPRLDGWHNITVNPKQIVLMPTWRLYLAQNPDTVFEDTLYFKTYQNFVSNKDLATFLEKNDLKLIFYLHNEMRKYVASFHTDSRNIEIVDSDEKYDIQELLKSSAMLITDYSSVHFDFAYMDKPVIYFQFDQKEFFSRQYEKSEFSAERDGFGSVVYDAEALMQSIREQYNNGFQMQPMYHDRMQAFYQLYDEHNCERVWDAIRERIIC